MTTRAVLYLRQSKEKEESISLENQEFASREYARQHGYTVVGVHADRISGRTWNRPGVQAAVAAIETGEADVIVVWRWSRLARSRKDWAIAVDRIESIGGRLESSTQPIDTSTSAGRFARGMLAEFAAFESEQISETWLETAENRRRRGLPLDGHPRYGYDKADGMYQPNEAESAVLRKMYQAVIRGESFYAVAQEVNAAGHLSKKGNPWTGGSVSAVLDSGFGAGKLVLRHGSNVIDNHEFLDGAQTPVITPSEWDQYLALRGRRKRDRYRPRGDTAMLTGLLYCEGCGAAMHRGRNAVTQLYTCSTRTGPHNGVPRPSMSNRAVEAVVTSWVMSIAADLDKHAADAARAARANDLRRGATQDRRTQIAAELDAEERRLTQLTVKYLDEKIPEDAYQATLRALNENVGRLRTERDALPTPTPAVDLSMIPTVAAKWEQTPPAVQNLMLRQIVRKVTVGPTPAAYSPHDLTHWARRVTVTPIWATVED